MAQITFQTPAVLLALPLLWLLLVIISWRRRLRPLGPFLLRLLIVVLVVLGLARPVLPAPPESQIDPQSRLIALVDQSASLPEETQRAFAGQVGELAGQFSRLEVLHFADQPWLLPPADPAGATAPALPLNPELSNLDKALQAGAKLLQGRSGRLLLLSDGLTSEPGRIEPVLAELARQEIPVDVFLPPANQPGNDVRLVGLNLPSILREGETFAVEVFLHSQTPAPVNLRLAQDGRLLAESEVNLTAGLNRFSFSAQAESIGPHSFQATINPPEEFDTQPANNSYAAVTQVYPPPRILVVGDVVVPGSRFINQLEEAGFVAERIETKALSSRLSDLEPYAGMVLLDVSARLLALEQMLAIQEFVRSLGRGLLVTGGRNSFSLGEYEATPLAELLPLSLEPPPRAERPPVALLLIIDHSGSMVEQNFLATKLAMAKEAAIRATDILGPDDLIGVLIFDNLFEWTIPFQAARDGAALLNIQSQIAAIDGGGGTRVLQALQVGLPELAAQNTFDGPRHAILFTDGKSFDGLSGDEAYDLVVDAAVAANITLSTIAIGDDADQALLSRLAERGRGRYHYAAEPDQLPALTIAESDILRSSRVQEGEYRPSLFAPHPMLAGFAGASAALSDGEPLEWPGLSGYIGLSPKPEAEIVLQVGPGDPLLGVWGYGLGRVAAWGGDIGQEWAKDWYSWSETSRFWGQVVGYTLPAPNLGLLQLSAEFEPGGVVVIQADGVTPTGQTVDLARTQASLITPAGREISLNLRQVSPGRYQQRVRLPGAGPYQLLVNQERPDGEVETARLGFVLPYPAEYSLPDPALGEKLLRQIAAASGGRAFVFGEAWHNPPCPAGAETCQAKTDPLAGATPLWPWLVQAALVLWPVEIAWRRWRRLRIQ